MISKTILLASLLLLQMQAFSQAYNSGTMYITGNVYLGTSTGGPASFTNASAANYLNTGDFYLTGDFTNNQTVAMLAGSATTPVTAGTIHFIGNTTTNVNGTQPLNFYSMEMNKNVAATRVDMAQNITAQYNLTLLKGIVTTANNLFTWGNIGGVMSSPGTGLGESGTGTFADSYIATCNSAGIPQTGGANATTPFSSTVGMRINNIGNNSTYFPVGATFIPSQTGFQPTPNRVMIKNSGTTAQWFTIAIDYGDIGGTPNPKVNRIWYIAPQHNLSTDQSTHTADMQLFYTKHTSFVGWPTTENEIEPGFLWNEGSLVQKDYNPADNNFINISLYPSTDVKNWNGSADGVEVYAQYTVASGASITNLVTNFNRFSVTVPTSLILPVTIINFKAYQQGSGVQTAWTCVNEKNIDHYEIQHSTNGTDFAGIGNVTALNNGQTSVNYTFYDAHPANGNNFYRVKAIGKDGTVSYTNIDLVNIGGAKSDISIFPNPVTSLNFTLQMTNMPGGKYALLIHNMIGQEILSQQIERQDGSSSQTVYLPAGTARGVYKVTLFNGTVKIIKTITVQ